MKFDAKTITLKDGRSAVLRMPDEADAEDMLNYLIETAGETEFLLAYPEERQGMTVEREADFIERMTQDENCLFLVCEVEGRVAGCCQVDFQTRMKTAHRGTVAIGLRKAYWGLGIGTAMFREMIDVSRRRGLMILELEFIEGNTRARALYEKMGFRIVGLRPDGIRLRDGTLCNEYLMQLRL